MNALKILICEDTDFIIEEFNRFFENKDAVVAFCKKDGFAAYDKINEFAPHIVITDVFLCNMDGVALAQKSAELKIPPLMFMALSAVDSDNIINFVINNGFDYYFVKPCSVDYIYQRILTLLNESEASENISAAESVLHYINMPSHLLGYGCIKTAIELVLNKPDIIHRVTAELYPSVAKIHNTTAQRVERSIRTAVEIAWVKGNAEALNTLFPYHFDNYKKPSSSEFIATVCDYIRTEYKKCSRF